MRKNWKYMLGALALGLTTSFGAEAEIDTSLQNQLLAMEKADISARNRLLAEKNEETKKALAKEVTALDAEHLETLKTIVDQQGWPKVSQVGIKGVQAAFLILQHAPDKVFQEKMLPYIKIAFIKKEGVSGQEVALLTDRVLVGQGKKQLYGTQAKPVTDKVEFFPIEEMDSVDQRRKSMGLPPLAYYKKILEETYGLVDHPDVEMTNP